MKEDYLWDKTGADPAIEKLENALSVFRFDESSLQIPVRAGAPVEGRRYFKFLSFGFAAAACACVAVISWALWAPVSNPDNAGPASEQAFTPPADTRVQEVPDPANGPDLPVAVEVKAPARESGHYKKAVKKAVRPVAVTARAKKPAPVAAPFTQEEIYAYNQLMLALSITSDKLNLVKEKIPGE
jgi:hypothetical protein